MDSISDTVIRMIVQDILEETKRCNLRKSRNEQENEKERTSWSRCQ